jgi:hypothetical protein
MKAQIAWSDFVEQYLEELYQERELVLELAQSVVAGRTIVLMCYEKAGEKCHRLYLCREIATAVRKIMFEEYDTQPLNETLTGGELCPSPRKKRVKK